MGERGHCLAVVMTIVYSRSPRPMPHRDPVRCLTLCSPAGGMGSGGRTRPGPGRPTRPAGGRTRPVSILLFSLSTPLASLPSFLHLVVGTNLLFLGARTPPDPSWRGRRITSCPAHPRPFFYGGLSFGGSPLVEPATTSTYFAASFSLFMAFRGQARVGNCRACSNPMYGPVSLA